MLMRILEQKSIVWHRPYNIDNCICKGSKGARPRRAICAAGPGVCMRAFCLDRRLNRRNSALSAAESGASYGRTETDALWRAGSLKRFRLCAGRLSARIAVRSSFLQSLILYMRTYRPRKGVFFTVFSNRAAYGAGTEKFPVIYLYFCPALLDFSVRS